MPFQRKWDTVTGEYIVDRDLTGPPRPSPETGTTVQTDGVVKVANQTVQPFVPPVTPVSVNFPGPNEPIVGANGLVSPRWWRFFDELYRRTGGVVDNINKAQMSVLGGSAPDALAFTGYAPTLEISHGPEMSLGSLTLTGEDADRDVV